MSTNGNGNGLMIWQAIAFTLSGIILTSFGGWLLFGLDSIKHSEIDGIIATRAPWIHDKQRIEDNIAHIRDHNLQLQEQINKLELRIIELEKKERKPDS